MTGELISRRVGYMCSMRIYYCLCKVIKEKVQGRGQVARWTIPGLFMDVQSVGQPRASHDPTHSPNPRSVLGGPDRSPLQSI